MKDEIIIGLDQALANTGYAIWKTTERKIIEYGVIKTESKEDLIVRLKQIVERISEIRKEKEVKYIFLEEIFCPRTSGTAWPQLLCVETVIKLYCLNNNIEYRTIKSRGKESWRAVLGIGNEKADMKEKIKGLSSNEHIADAIGILMAGLRIYTELEIDSNLLNYVKEQENGEKTGIKRTNKTRKRRVTNNDGNKNPNGIN